MSFNFKRVVVQDNPVQLCIFGKLPNRTDFVRINAAHPAASELDGLLSDSLQRLTHGDGWQDGYHAMPPSRFVFRSRDYRWLFLGAWLPSRDQAGREYPLVAGILIPAEAAAEPLSTLMLANELFFSGIERQLVNAMDNSVEMLACRQYLEEQVSLGGLLSGDFVLARQLIDAHLKRTPAQALNEALITAGLGDLESVLLSFTFHQRLSRRFVGSLPPQAYLLPLPQDEGAAMLAAVTWLTLYDAATAGQGGVSEQCLMLNRPEGRQLVLLPGVLTETVASMSWGQPVDRTCIVDIGDSQAPWRAHHSYAEAAYVLARQINDPTLSVASLREIVRNLSGSIG